MKLDSCLCCGGSLVLLKDFGMQPLVNTYAVTEKFPLKVNRCTTCCHLQLSESVDPEILYKDYTYLSGTGETARAHFRSFAKLALSYVPDAVNVLDIACNDGSQLDEFVSLNLETWGVEPARNIALNAFNKGHRVEPALFEDTHWTEQFDIISAQNVLAHTARPLEFLKKCAECMHDRSRLFVATSQANMIVNGEVGSCYHEHVSYFNVQSMLRLSESAGLEMVDLHLLDVHGTSYLFVFGKRGARVKMQRVCDRIAWEDCVGMTDSNLYHWWWTNHIDFSLHGFRDTINAHKEHGFYTVGVSAAAKGVSMLNMAGVKLSILCDNTPTKHGKTTSEMEILPFESIGTLKQEKILFVILAHNISEELRKNVLSLRNQPQDVFITAK